MEELIKTYNLTLLSNHHENEVLYKDAQLIVPFDIVSRLKGKVFKTLSFSYFCPAENVKPKRLMLKNM